MNKLIETRNKQVIKAYLRSKNHYLVAKQFRLGVDTVRNLLRKEGFDVDTY